MSTEQYKIVFDGTVVTGANQDDVKANLKTIFNLDESSVERFFSGRNVTLKRKLDALTAQKYQRTLERAGAVCQMVSEIEEESMLGLQMENSQMDANDTEAVPNGSSESEQITCPKCGWLQDHAADCVQCGINFAKFNATVNSCRALAVGKEEAMILTNIESIPGRQIIEHFGLVSGSTIRAKHIGRDFMAGLKNLVGGELKGYTELLNESRRQAVDRMKEQARQLGGNAIINVRFSTSSVAQGASELYAYGTAVRVE